MKIVTALKQTCYFSTHIDELWRLSFLLSFLFMDFSFQMWKLQLVALFLLVHTFTLGLRRPNTSVHLWQTLIFPSCIRQDLHEWWDLKILNAREWHTSCMLEYLKLLFSRLKLFKCEWCKGNFSENSFHVLWENVSLEDDEDVGPFTFGASFFPNGTLVFKYFSIPTDVSEIKDGSCWNFKAKHKKY